jgi:hypothetical protein
VTVADSPIGPAVDPGATAVFETWLIDYRGDPIPASAMSSLTLTIIDTASQTVVNGVQQVDILNTDRGSLQTFTAPDGSLAATRVTVNLQSGDTELAYPTSSFRGRVQRSLIFGYTYNAGRAAGGHRSNFWINGYPSGTYLSPVPLLRASLPFYFSYGWGGSFSDLAVSEVDGNYWLFDVAVADPVTLPPDLTTSVVPSCSVAPLTMVTLTLQWVHANVPQSIGVATIAATATVGTYSTGGVGYVIPFGDRLRLIAPPDVDKTMLGLAGTIVGTFQP